MSQKAAHSASEPVSATVGGSAGAVRQVTCRQPGCWRFGGPQDASIPRCPACGHATVAYPLDAFPKDA